LQGLLRPAKQEKENTEEKVEGNTGGKDKYMSFATHRKVVNGQIKYEEPKRQGVISLFYIVPVNINGETRNVVCLVDWVKFPTGERINSIAIPGFLKRLEEFKDKQTGERGIGYDYEKIPEAERKTVLEQIFDGSAKGLKDNVDFW
jgi:hypothetical protein